jgi:hypothetical protein
MMFYFYIPEGINNNTSYLTHPTDGNVQSTTKTAKQIPSGI